MHEKANCASLLDIEIRRSSRRAISRDTRKAKASRNIATTSSA
jgi:hypothetical protein